MLVGNVCVLRRSKQVGKGIYREQVRRGSWEREGDEGEDRIVIHRKRSYQSRVMGGLDLLGNWMLAECETDPADKRGLRAHRSCVERMSWALLRAMAEL